MFRDKLKQARHGLPPWERTPPRRLRRLGRSLTSDEVGQGIAFLLQLTLQREALELDPVTNADDTDDVWTAQKEVSVALGHVRRDRLPALVEGLRSTSRGTRFFTAGALLVAVDRTTVAAMVAAREIETDELTRRVLTRAIDIAGAPRWPRGRAARSR